MKLKTMTAAVLLASTLGLAETAIAQDGVEGRMMILRMTGSHGWSVECELNTERGGDLNPNARGRGRGARGTVVGRNVVGGTCSAEAGQRGPLQITLEDDDANFICPFGDLDTQGFCRTSLAEDGTLEWTVERTANS